MKTKGVGKWRRGKSGSLGTGGSRPLCGGWLVELWSSTLPPAPDSPSQSLAAHPHLPSSDPDLISGEVARFVFCRVVPAGREGVFPHQSPSVPVGKAGVCCALPTRHAWS